MIEDSEVLVKAENVSKKFCRSLKKSLWYGVKDILSSVRTRGGREREGAKYDQLRPDEFWAVRNVSFELRRGDCIGLIGHNGAGKSTLLKILNGILLPDTGRITMKGRVAALIELNAGFNGLLTGRENIYNQAALLGFTKAETDAKFSAIVEFAEIGDFLDMPVQNYSSGMRVRLGFAVAAQMEPDVLIVDEVLAVGDVAFRFKCLNAIGEIMKRAAVIFVTHTMPQVFRICNEVMVLDHGVVTCQTRTIGEGVAVYLSLFKTGGSNVAGTGEVRVDQLCASVDESSVEMGGTLTVPFGTALQLVTKLKCAESIKRARIQFLLWNSEMLPVLDVMSENLQGMLFAVPRGGEVEVSAFIPRLEINAGKYSISVIVLSEDQLTVACRHDNAAFIQVEASCASGAHVITVADWKMHNAGNPSGIS